MTRPAFAVLLLLAMSACGQNNAGGQPLPLGTWQIENPDEAARRYIAENRAAVARSGGWDHYDDAWLRELTLKGYREMLFDFREDGTVHQLSQIRPWDSGRWTRDGDAVTVKVERYGDIELDMDIPFRIEGGTLYWTLQPGQPIRLRRMAGAK